MLKIIVKYCLPKNQSVILKIYFETQNFYNIFPKLFFNFLYFKKKSFTHENIFLKLPIDFLVNGFYQIILTSFYDIF